jgi:SAM-dependent methyltransferase
MDRAILDTMRSDWNRRAAEDAYYYAAFTRRKQQDGEFFQSAAAVLAWLESEMGRLDPAAGPKRALEIGCGPARLMRPLSAHFAEIQGVDVSDEMVRIAQRNLAGIPHACVQRTSGADLAPFPDGYFDFVYSYAVFQHIPRREVVMAYLREAWRVLRTDGVLTCQMNGLPPEAQGGTTWDGARVSAAEVVTLARELDCQLVALENPASQYMWTTWRKRVRCRSQGAGRDAASGGIRSIRTDAGEPASIPAGRRTHIYARVEGLPADCDLLELSATVSGCEARPSLILASSAEGVVEVKIVVPPLRDAGLAPVALCWRAKPLGPPRAIEVTAASQDQPSVFSLTDGVNALSGLRIVSRSIKAQVENLTDPNQLSASLNGIPTKRGAPYCVDEQTRWFDINFFLPRAVGPGAHRLELFYRSTLLLTRQVHVGMLQAVDVFRGVRAGARLLEVDAVSLGAGNAVRATVLTVSVEGAQQAGDAVDVDVAHLPFLPRTLDGIVCRVDPEHRAWDGLAAEIRRVLKEERAFYLELPRLGNIKPAELASVLERGTGLPFRWGRPLGRSLAPRRRSGRIGGVTPELLRAALSLGLRVIDRFRGTRLAANGRGFYFGHLWTGSAPAAMLNACTRCGKAHSSAQLQAAGAIVHVFILHVYLCPSCGCRNVLTLDR